MTKSKELKKIRKRNGNIVSFNQDLITSAIFKASQAVDTPDKVLAEKLSKKVVSVLIKKFDSTAIPTV